MLTQEQNDHLTRTGPGTPGGELLRRYWQPVALSAELPAGGGPVPVDIMAEELVLFRDEAGRVGLLDRHCCHRGTDLSYGRLENGGLRCLYHGWLYDVDGTCLEQPAEPKGSTFKDKVRQTAYPVVERGGAFWAYLGPGVAPEFPAYDFLTFPGEHIHVHKLFIDSNYLQANEGNYDPAHVGYLHRTFDPNRRPGLIFGNLKLVGVTPAEADLTQIDPGEPPRLSVEETPFGLRIFQHRSGGPGKKYLRVTNFVMPNASVIAGPQGGDGQIGHWHVPIDDRTHWRWNFLLRRDQPLGADWTTPNHLRKPGEYEDAYHITRKRSNRFLQDRATMNQTFAGMGNNFNTHDAFATETPGPIQDRTKEHLATSDIALAAARKQMLRAIDDVRAGHDPRGVVRQAADNDFRALQSFDVLAGEALDDAEIVRCVVTSEAVVAV